jgi:SAM-dependent methyltransferase
MEQPTTDGFAHEIEFWKGFVKSERFLNNWVFPEQNPEIRANHPDVAKCFDDFYAQWVAEQGGEKEVEPDHMRPHVLDVGSGALSWIKGLIRMRLYSCDPLAHEYREIFDYHSHPNAINYIPHKVSAEELSKEYPENFFDIVHCSNALDHTQNPYKAILEMERVCRPGGMILIQGFENEAIHEDWKGLHQWNIRQCKTHLEVRSKEDHETGSVLSYLDHKPDEIIYANTTTIQTGAHAERNWFVFAYKNTK